METNTHDIVFNDNESSSDKGFIMTLQEAKDWIKFNKSQGTSYFPDYKGGAVSIVCNETGETVYSEPIK